MFTFTDIRTHYPGIETMTIHEFYAHYGNGYSRRYVANVLSKLRRLAAIDAIPKAGDCLPEECISLLGTMNDSELGRRFNVPRTSIGYARRQRGIKRFWSRKIRSFNK